MAGSVIIGGARTPFGKLSGSLAGFAATELGGFAIAGALERAGVSAGDVDYVFMGHVLQAGAGQITARQAAVNAGISMDVPAMTINKVCLSGMNAIALADMMINAGHADVVVAGGMESMTNAPYLLPDARAGLRMGDKTVVDSMMYDGLFCAFDQCAMGAGTEKYAASMGLPRDAQDELAANSHERAVRAQKDGFFDHEIVKVDIPQRKGDPILFEEDEGVRSGTTAESLGNLRPAFDKAGNITAGNASQISDGGAAVIVASPAAAERLGATPIAEILASGQVAGPDASLLTQPSRAINAALDRGRHVRVRHRPVRAERGLRRSRGGVDGRAGNHARDHQRQRRCHLHRSPARRFRYPHHADVDQRTASSGRRHRRCCTVRWWRTGRGPARQGSLRSGCSADAPSAGVCSPTRRLPSRALPRVSSSAYSRSPPTGRPLAILLTVRPGIDSTRLR